MNEPKWSTNVIGFDRPIYIEALNTSVSLENTTIGVYIYSFQKARKAPKLFSYRKHVLFEYFSRPLWRDFLSNFNIYHIQRSRKSPDTAILSVDDVRILGDDTVQFRLGFVVAHRLPNSPNYTCGYVALQNTLYQTSNVVSIFKDGGFWLQFPIFIIAVFLLGTLTICGQSFFENQTTRISSIRVAQEESKLKTESPQDSQEQSFKEKSQRDASKINTAFNRALKVWICFFIFGRAVKNMQEFCDIHCWRCF